MGGMIAQTIAIRYPERALSLVSLFSNTGGFLTGQPALTMYAVLLRPAPRERERFINHAVVMFEKIGGKGYEPGVEDLTAIATRSFDRGGDPAGPSRQLAAIVADRDRAPQLRRLNLPATVIHGTDDKLVQPSGGRATARAIPGARLVEIDGMGHGLPRGAWPIILDAIEDTARRAEAPLTTARG
jgi:pimeloyl-ACP methyl ester carboxylesterase